MDRLHNALKSELLETKSVPNFQLALAKLQWGKTEFCFSVHINSNTWISSGLQGNTLLQQLGLEHSACSFLHGECWAMSVPEGFDLSAFATTLEGVFNGMREAEKKLEACGLRLVEDRSGRSSVGGRGSYYGDGHTSNGTPNKIEEASDGHFDFVFTFQDTPGGKGWTTHRHPKTELSLAFAQALEFIGVKKMTECPQFDFGECYWSFTPFTGDGFQDEGNTDWALRSFDGHAANFTAAVHQLASVNEMLQPYGMGIFND